MQNPKINVIIPSYNGLHLLRVCIPSLLEVDYPSNLLEIYVIDNASTDRTLESIQREFPTVKVLRNDTNLGFATALNKAVEEIDAEFVAFLNNDTRVHNQWIKGLLEPFELDGCVCSSSKILNWEGNFVEFYGSYINFIGKGFEEKCPLDSIPSNEAPFQLFCPCGCSMLIKKNDFMEYFGFDSDYFALYEDVDLGWRLNLFGKKIFYAPKSIVYHRPHSSLDKIKSNDRIELLERNSLMTIYKNFAEETLRAILPATLLLAIKRIEIFSNAEKKLHYISKLKNIFSLKSNNISPESMNYIFVLSRLLDDFPNLNRKRHLVQSKRKLPEIEILKYFKEPFKLWAFNDEHYKLLRDSDYEEMREVLCRELNLYELFPVTSSPIEINKMPIL